MLGMGRIAYYEEEMEIVCMYFLSGGAELFRDSLREPGDDNASGRGPRIL